jgi:hypothetical protein
MLEKCRRDQWQVGDLDWTGTPRPMSASDEMAVVQYFTDMAGIERLAGALFEVQRRKTDSPILAEIFESFVKDEIRHAHAAQMLADYYDVHRFKEYRQSEALQDFAPVFIEAVRHAPPELANAFVTGGELMLDIALLRSLDDYVDDTMMRNAMRLINRDESRHVAVDFHMVEYYSSEEYAREQKRRPPSVREAARGAAAFAKVVYHSRPFFKAVFFEPMSVTDPQRTRLREAIKRMQLLNAKPNVARQPLSRFMRVVQDITDMPVVGAIFSTLFSRVYLVEPEYSGHLASDEEMARAASMTFDEMAQEALSSKS